MTAAVMDGRLFVDGVMERIASEPLPTPARALRAAVATFDAGLAAGATWTAWHLATSHDMHVRRGMRIRSALLVAMLMALLAMGTTLAAAGATVVFRHFTDDHSAPQTTTSNGQTGAGGSGLPVILSPTTPGTHSSTSGDGPPEDATDEPGGDHDGAPGPDAAAEPGDDDDPGDEEDNGGTGEGSDDPSVHDGDDPAADQDGSVGGAQDNGWSGDEGSPDQEGEAAEPTGTPTDDDSPGDGGKGGEET
jgi:hypothetical protein